MSYIGTHRSMWPHVTSRYAHDVVQAAFDALPPTEVDELPLHGSHRQWLQKKLEGSQLAKLLPAGLDLLPDYYAALPAWQRPLLLLSKPRTYSDLVNHLITHLEWYLEPTRPAKGIHLLRASVVLIPVLLVPLTLLLTGGLGFVFVFMLMAVTSILASLAPYNSMFRSIDAEEFYKYIKDAYSDPVD